MAKATYGIPYKGSKAEICDSIIRIFPKSDNFYDLFGGGFSITHAMLKKRGGDYKEFHFNEIRPGICDLIKDAIDGKYSYDSFTPAWVGREKFFELKEKDPFVKILWSFGNNGQDYLFSKEIEPYKKSMHNAIVFNKFDELAENVFGFSKFRDGYPIKERRLFLRYKIEFYRKSGIPKFLYPYINEQNFQKIQRLQHLEQLEQLEQLQKIKSVDKLVFHEKSYEKVEIKKNSIVYCDPPYKGTSKYDNDFNHNKFLDWCDSQENPVFISEYDIQDNRFKCIFSVKKRSRLNVKTSIPFKEEKIYTNKAGFKKLLHNKWYGKI